MKGRVHKASQKLFEVVLEENKERVSAGSKGTLLKDGSIVVGDLVEVTKYEDEYLIEEVYERKNEISRHLPREGKVKITAANCDLMIILMSVSKPQFKRGLVDRYLLRAEQWGIPVVLIFNKIDEWKPKKLDIEFEKDRLKGLVDDFFCLSAKFPDTTKEEFERFRNFLRGKVSIFLGHSGVGKSKTISALSEGKVQLLSKEIGKVGKGAHTTTWSEIVEFEDITLIDSPGIRSYSLEDIPVEDLVDYFPDLHDLIPHCKFTDCQHLENSPGCRFLDFRTNPTREGDLILSRLDSYVGFLDELSQTPSWEKKKNR